MLVRTLRRFLTPYRREITIVVALQLVGTIASLALPSLNADIIDNGVIPGDTAYILRVGGWMLAVSLIQVASTIVAVYFGAKTAMALGRDIRSAFFHHVIAFSSREMAYFGAPSLLTRNTNDVQQIQMLVLMTFTMLITAPIMMVGGVFMALREDVGLSWLIVALVPVLALIIWFIVSHMVPGFRIMQRRLDAVNLILREQITGIRVVRAFVREPFETERFGEANADLTGVSISVGRWMAAIFPSVVLVMNFSSVAVLWFGAVRVDSGAMQIGSLTAFITYIIQILMSVMMATFMFMLLPRASVSADRIQEVFDTGPSVIPPTDGLTKLPKRSVIEFDRTGFSYPGASHSVLNDISFSSLQGETTAVIGSTGSGKTTLVSLIPRLFDATEGRVLVGGIDVRAIDPDTLRGKIGLVPQSVYLFSGTVATNLLYGKPDATETEMWEALDIAQASEFVSEMPDGLGSYIAQGGTNVSGGQRQRLAIARALIRRPEVYLFDDSFSALDVATDARLRHALKEITTDATVIIVAQRIATIRDADQIVVVADGGIVGIGTHDELLETCVDYSEIVDSQLASEVS